MAKNIIQVLKNIKNGMAKALNADKQDRGMAVELTVVSPPVRLVSFNLTTFEPIFLSIILTIID